MLSSPVVIYNRRSENLGCHPVFRCPCFFESPVFCEDMTPSAASGRSISPRRIRG